MTEKVVAGLTGEQLESSSIAHDSYGENKGEIPLLWAVLQWPSTFLIPSLSSGMIAKGRKTNFNELLAQGDVVNLEQLLLGS